VIDTCSANGISLDNSMTNNTQIGISLKATLQDCSHSQCLCVCVWGLWGNNVAAIADSHSNPRVNGINNNDNNSDNNSGNKATHKL